jgi:hypothetical protein
MTGRVTLVQDAHRPTVRGAHATGRWTERRNGRCATSPRHRLRLGCISAR